jgi:uncharacterized protein
MDPPIDSFDLKALRLTPGEGRRLELEVHIEPFELGADRYPVEPPVVPVRLDVSRMAGSGHALRLRFTGVLAGPCMRCLEAADTRYEVDAREVSEPGAGAELASPYVVEGVLDLAAWGRDALALILPRAILCREDCAGLCSVCGVNLNAAGPDHRHEPGQDPRWAKLSELKFDR